MVRGERLQVRHVQGRTEAPLEVSATRASVSTTALRDTFTSSAPSGIRASRRASNRPLVPGLSGTATTTTSASPAARPSLRSHEYRACGACLPARWTPKPSRRLPSALPTPPHPTTTTRASAGNGVARGSSDPGCHPARPLRFPRWEARIKVIASSAVLASWTPGAAQRPHLRARVPPCRRPWRSALAPPGAVA